VNFGLTELSQSARTDALSLKALLDIHRKALLRLIDRAI